MWYLIDSRLPLLTEFKIESLLWFLNWIYIQLTCFALWKQSIVLVYWPLEVLKHICLCILKSIYALIDTLKLIRYLHQVFLPIFILHHLLKLSMEESGLLQLSFFSPDNFSLLELLCHFSIFLFSCNHLNFLTIFLLLLALSFILYHILICIL